MSDNYPAAQVELKTLETVEMRLAMADSADKFTALLDMFLPALLLKLASPNIASIRPKILGILSHVNSRVKAASDELKLPVKDLLALFHLTTLPSDIPTHAASATGLQLVKNFALIYLEMAGAGVAKEIGEGDLVRGFGACSRAQQMILFQLFLQRITEYPTSTADEHPSQSVLFSHDLDTITALMTCLTQVLLFVGGTVDVSVPAGMSIQSVKAIVNGGKAQWCRSISVTNTVKLAILAFLLQNAFIAPTGHSVKSSYDEQKIRALVFSATLVACCDTNHEVVSTAETLLKKLGLPDFETDAIVQVLATQYFGKTTLHSPTNALILPTTPIADKLKERVLKYLCRSAAVSNTVYIKPIIEDSVFRADAPMKLRLAGMSFLQWVVRMATTETVIQVLGTESVQRLKEFIMAPPSDDSSSKFVSMSGGDREAVRGYAYTCIGLIVKRCPALFSSDMATLQFMFQHLSSDTITIRSSISDAIMDMRFVFVNVQGYVTLSLQKLLWAAIVSEEHRARFCAINYANTCFLPSDGMSKLFCLLATQDSKLEIKEEGRSGLSGLAEHIQARDHLASVEELCLLLSQCMPALSDDNHMSVDTELSRQFAQMRFSSARILKRLSGVSTTFVITVLQYLFYLMLRHSSPTDAVKVYSALAETSTSDFSGEEQDEVQLTQRQALHKWMSGQGVNLNASLSVFLKISFIAISDENSDSDVKRVGIRALREILICSPKFVHDQYIARIGTFKELLTNEQSDIRTIAAHVVGLVASGADNTFVQTLLQSFFVTSSNNAELKCGYLEAVGFIIGKRIYATGKSFAEVAGEGKEALFVGMVTSALSSSNQIVVISALVSLAEVGRYVALDKALGEDRVKALIATLLKIAENSTDAKTLNRAVLTLAHCCFLMSEYRSQVLTFLFSLADKMPKLLDLHFSVGESLTVIACGSESSYLKPYFDIIDAHVSTSHIDDRLDFVLNKIMDEFLVGTASAPLAKPAGARRAALIWLLSIVKGCSTSPALINSLPSVHTAMSVMLSDRDEFTQDIAAKGVGLVYQMGSEDVKAALVRSLVGSLGGGENQAPTAMKVSDDTQIFDANVVGTLPDGGSVTTYKELCSLASDMNKPDLVYKFMSLATHHQTWNTRRGAAFGFEQILANAKEELKEFLPTLVPKLYRYSFDPNLKVAESMKSIWNALIPNQKQTIDEYYDVIMKDVLNGMGDRLWRTRESSCNCTLDLLQRREISTLRPYLEQLWMMAFRAMDDIKESVRQAAYNMSKTLTNICVRNCDPSVASAQEGAQIMLIVVPYMLNKGLMTSAEDVRKFSLATILQICKTAGKFLKPHVADIAFTLLEAMSSLEPQMMNYLSFHVDKYQISQSQLETSRMAQARMGPVMEAVNICVDHIDEENIKVVTPRLTQIIRKGVGLATRAGCAAFVVMLVVKSPHSLREDSSHADAIMKSLSGTINDRSVPLQKSFASACGYLAKMCSSMTMEKFIVHVRGMYCDKTELESRLGATLTFSEISKHSPDVFKQFESDILPIAFLGTHDADETVKKVWSEVWEANISRPSTAVKMFAKEIVELVTSSLKSQSWPIKTQAALTISAMSTLLGADMHDEMQLLFPLFQEALQGRTWAGKEIVLNALSLACVSCRLYFVDKDGVFVKKTELLSVFEIFIKESGKNNKMYKRYAIESMATLLQAFPELDVFEKVYDIIRPIAEEELDKDAMEEDDAAAKPVFHLLRAAAFRCIGASWPKTSESHIQDAKDVVDLYSKYLKAPGLPWNIRSAILDGIKSLVDVISDQDYHPLFADHTFASLLDSILSVYLETKYTTLRELATTVLFVIQNKFGLCYEYQALVSSAEMPSKIQRCINDEANSLISGRLKELSLLWKRAS